MSLFRKGRGRRKTIGTVTFYLAFDAFRRYLYGEITLEEFSKLKVSTVTRRLFLYEDGTLETEKDPEPIGVTLRGWWKRLLGKQ
jgi:hypothetical protein